MGLTIYQLNVRYWKTNKYSIETDLRNYNPDFIMLNETSLEPLEYPKIRGFESYAKSNGRFSGVALLVKNGIKFEIIEVTDDNTVAIKAYTNIGPLVLSTNYCAPSQSFIPTTSISSILKHNLPTIIISDFNAHHKIFC